MDTKITYARPDGGVSVVTLVEGHRLAHLVMLADGTVIDAEDPVPVERLSRKWRDGKVKWAETEEQFVTRNMADPRIVPADCPAKIVPASEIPDDRTFRNAWTPDLSIDLDKAKEITKQRLRSERGPKLAALDVEFMKALETGADTKAITAEKQRLRDITALADEAKTPDDLKALTAASAATEKADG